MSFPVTDLWPEGVGYDSYAGYNSVEVKTGQDNAVPRMNSIVKSWKHTAEQHKLNLPAVKALSFEPCEDDASCFDLAFAPSGDVQSLVKARVQVSRISATVDVDESPFEKETSIYLLFEGQVCKQSTPFTLTISVDRYPEKSASVNARGI